MDIEAQGDYFPVRLTKRVRPGILAQKFQLQAFSLQTSCQVLTSAVCALRYLGTQLRMLPLLGQLDPLQLPGLVRLRLPDWTPSEIRSHMAWS